MNDVIAWVAQYGLIVSAVITIVVWLRLPGPKKWEFALMGLIGGAIALLLLELAGKLYYDPRPFVVEHIAPLFQHDADNGFPSDHTLLATFLAACVFFYSRKWSMVLLAVALAIGVTRVAAHVHHPIDIVAAMALALASALIARPVAVRVASRLPIGHGRTTGEAGGRSP